uniref:Uncharacterized protein n=1 Tax=Schistocephalus solidus TaxID=70667 RepID=A0A0X3PBW6_SCHSO
MCSSVDTFASWATRVTNCSNPTFDIVINRLWSNPNMQKDVLAVLAGVTKLIQSRNGTESAAEYYAALLSLLNTDSSTKSAEAYLLRLIICKAVPVSLLRKTCSESSKTLTNVLMAALQEDILDISLCKSTLLALGRVLAAQSSDSWSSESVRHTYRIFLQFVDHENPTIRKTCQTAVLEILTSSLSQEGIHHPVCHQTVSHLCTLIRQERNHISTLIRTTDESFGRILRCLNLLKNALPLVPEKDIKIGCECALELTEIPNSLVVKATFECLQAIFSGCAKEDSLPLEMAGKLMSALFTCRPQEPSAVESVALQRETESITCWLHCLRNGVAFLITLILNSATTSPDLTNKVAIEHFEHLVKLTLLLVVNTPIPGLRDIARDILLALFADQLNTLLQHGELLDRRPRLLPELCLTIQSALTLSRREAWPHLLRITSQLFRIWPSALPEFTVFQPDLSLPPEITSLIVHVASVRDALVDGAGANEIGVLGTKNTAQLIDEMDRLLLISLESWGIEFVLKDALPLHCLLDELESGSVELRRSWLLPLLARARPSRPCSLAFFFTTLLPLADRGVAVSKAAAANKFSRKMGASSGGSRKFVPLSAILNSGLILARQIWEVLLTFTRKPPSRWSDLVDSGLGGRLVNGLINSKAVRPIILSALRRLVSFANTDEAIKVMRVGARQMIPSILSLYEEQESTNDQQLKQQLRAALIAFFPLLGSKMLSMPSEMAFQKLKSTGRPIYMEILQLVIPHLAEENIKSLLLGLEVYLTSEKTFPALKKPSYRVLEAVLSSSQPEAEMFVRHNLTSLISLMCKTAPKTSFSDHSTTKPDVLCSNMAELTVSTKPLHKSAKASGITPWKSRLRILRCLLRALTIELSAVEDLPKTTIAPEIEVFINIFLPEVLPQFNHLNNMVRILAGRLLVDMVRACAGLSLADERVTAVFGSRHISSGISDCGTLAVSKLEADDDEDASSYAASHAPTEITSINSAMTIAGMDPALATKVCSALQTVLTRLWPSILELSNDQLKQSSVYATQLIAISKSVIRVLGDTFLRRALLTNLDGQVTSEEDGDVMEQQSPTPAQILAAANTASRTLVSCPNCSLARLGLRLSRLLVAFIGRSVYVSDIVVNIQSLHDSHKHPLRFVVKGLVEKLLRKASVQALQSLMDQSYHKIIRNSAKLQMRRERKRAAATASVTGGSSCKGSKANRDEDVGESDDENGSASRRSGRPVSLRTASVKSFGAASASTVSQARRVHIECLNDILAPSSEEEEDTAQREKAQRTSTKASAGLKPAPEQARRRGLAAELETAASIAGLSRRSRRLMAGGTGDDQSSTEDDDSEESLSQPRRPRVRFADEAALEPPSRKRRNRTVSAGDFSTWLVEDTGTEVLDLAEPEALARHTAVASSADMARRTHAQRQGTLGSAAGSKRARLTSLSCFPERDGRLVIEESTVDKQTEHDDWLLPDDEQTGTPPAAAISAAVAAAVASFEKKKTAKSGLSLPGAIYRSARAQGDMKKPGLPDPFAYVPLGAGVSAAAIVGKRKRKNRMVAANVAERRLLLRSMGAGKLRGTKKAVKTTKGSSKSPRSGKMLKSKRR